MQKVRIEYDSSVEALIALAKRLSLYEYRFGMSSEIFFERYRKGLTEDSADFVEWAGDYQHFLAIKSEVETSIRHVA